jgi:MYXO-CTERM domain-containing protein
VSAPFDLAGIMKQVHFAYRPEGGGFAGGHRTYEVRASAGDFAFTPAADGAVAEVPARFATTSIARGGARRAPAAGEAHVAADGHLAVARGEVTEHLRNDRDGVEHSFELQARPGGAGDLVVRVRVTGEEYAGLTAGGHHFRDPATGLGARYGAATWIDGSGRRTPLAVAWTGAELAVTVPEDVVEASVYPAVLDPTVSPELGIDTPVPQTAQGDQTIPAVGFDGNDYLVAWNDTRVVGSSRLMATRVSGAGVVLDSTGTPLAAKQYVQIGTNQPAIGFDGTNYLVVWVNSSYGAVRSVRVSPAGVVLDSTPLTINTSYYSTPPGVAFDGTNYLVVGSNGSTVVGNRVSKAGALVGSTTTISNATGNQTAPAVAFDGTNYFVAWQDNRGGFNYDIYGSRVSPAGTVLDGVGTGVAISTAANDQLTPAIAFDGTNYLVAWSDGRWGTPDIYGARVSPAGLVLDASGIGVSSMTPNAQTAPRVAFDGTNHVIVWADTRSGNADVYAARVSPAGTILDASGIAVSAGAAGEQAPALACSSAGTCLAAWQDQRGGTWDAYGARLAGGAVGDPAGVELTHAANDEVTPAVAFDGTNYLVVWQDHRSAGSWDVYGARVSAAGTVLDTSGIPISTAVNDQLTPRLAWMAPSYLVVWEDKRAGTGDIYGARVDATGAVLDATGLAISTAANEQRTPAVAADGTNYFVAWSDARGGSYLGYGARVSAAGAALDPAGISFTTGAAVTSPGVAYDGTRYLVVWSTGAIRGNRVTTAGATLDGTTGFQINASGTAPQITFDGLNFFTVFEHSSGVFGARVSGAAAVLDATGLPIAPLVSYVRDQPAIGCAGAACLVAWREGGVNTSSISGAFVDQSGTVLNAGGFGISTNARDHVAPAVARDLAGHALVLYQTLDLDPPAGSQRVHARLVTSLGQGQPCAAATDCASGFCADGVCCNTACGGGVDTDCLACSAAKGASADGTCTPLTATTCSDGNACTQTDTCQAGTCMGGNPVTCTASDACHTAGTCAPATGTCSNPAKANGSACADGNACTQTDTCQSGACVGANPVTCPPAPACHQVAACDPTTGTCAITPVADGTACDDGNKCTQGDTCQAGVCTGGAPTVCAALDACHDAGACNPSTGVCTNPHKADGSACSDGDACTQADTCMSGVCVGGSPVTCPVMDQCHTAGACDPVTGTCSNPAKADGSTCSDGDSCTDSDTCQGGVCTGGTPVVCKAKDACHDVGTCKSSTGVCSDPNKPDGTPCSGGKCTAGKCGPDTSSSSSSSSSSSGGAGGAGGGTASSSSGGASTSSGGGAGGGEPSGSGGAGGSPGKSEGCGCRTVGEGEGSTPGGAAALVLALAAAARRKRSARRAA